MTCTTCSKLDAGIIHDGASWLPEPVAQMSQALNLPWLAILITGQSEMALNIGVDMQGAVETGKTSLDKLYTLGFIQLALEFIVAYIRSRQGEV